MRDPKEAFTSAKPGDTSKEAGVRAGDAAYPTGTTSTDVKFCHGSVCLGSQKPTNCVCPTIKK